TRAPPPPTARLHTPRRRHPRGRRNPQDRSRHPQPPAGRPLRRLPLRRRLRSWLRRSRRPQGPRRAPHRWHRLPLPFHRYVHPERHPPPRLRLRQPRQRPGSRRLEPPHERTLSRGPQRARRTEPARRPSNPITGTFRMSCPTDSRLFRSEFGQVQTWKVLLTGALGNVGASTVDALLAEGHDVVAFELESPRARKLATRFDERVHVTWGNVTDPASMRTALDGVDAVVHLAAIVNPEKAPDLARRVNVDATRSRMAPLEASPTARRLVFASSVGIFGDLQDREPPLRVDTPVSPTND